MTGKTSILLLLFGLLLMTNCTENSTPRVDFEKEKAAILDVLNNETKAAFTRDYEGWKQKWVQKPYVTKTYINFADNTSTETIGWKEVDDFVRTYIEEHPDPDPLPTPIADIDVRLYGTGAWVSYEQKATNQGLKRETRLMEKENGQWKIAGMHTTIYRENND